MANKSNKYAGFMSAADERLNNIFMEQATAANQGAPVAVEDPYSNLSDDEKFALEAAVVNGYPDTSEYAMSAYNLYEGLLKTAQDEAVKNHYKPNTEQYDDFVQRYMYTKWPDDQILGVDQTKNMYDLYTANKLQEEQEKRNAQFRGNSQFSGSAAGLSPSDISDLTVRQKNGDSIFTGEGLFSGYGQSGRSVGQRFEDAYNASAQITPPWQNDKSNIG